MTQILGLVIVILIVSGALATTGSLAIFEALPFELALICGAGAGTLLIANSPSVAKAAIGGFGVAVCGPKWRSRDYGRLFCVLHELTRRARQRGLVAIENDIEAPESSAVFALAPKLTRDAGARKLICDAFRMMSLDLGQGGRAREAMDEAITASLNERYKAVSALRTLADALPALGIVAAILGIIKTMGVIDQSAAVLGEMIATALLGTFLGVFLAYGLVGPVAERFAQVIDEEAVYLETIRKVLSAHGDGMAPRTSIEMARAALPAHLQPEPGTLDTALQAARFESARAA